MTEHCGDHHMVQKMAQDVREIKVCLLGDPMSTKAGGLRAEVDRHAAMLNYLGRLVWLVIGSGIAAAAAVIITR